MTSKIKNAPTSIHQLKLTLKRSRPPIWRRLLVSSDVNLGQLHYIIQTTMGWDNSHLHEFRVGDSAYGDVGLIEDMDYENELGARLVEVAPRPKDRIQYQYDFGDSWDHLIVVEAVLPPDPEVRYPVCVAGKRACPPEDCGGMWGYDNLLATLQDTQHPERDELLEWLGGPFDSEAFDMNIANVLLGQFKEW